MHFIFFEKLNFLLPIFEYGDFKRIKPLLKVCFPTCQFLLQVSVASGAVALIAAVPVKQSILRVEFASTPTIGIEKKEMWEMIFHVKRSGTANIYDIIQSPVKNYCSLQSIAKYNLLPFHKFLLL